MNVMSLWKSKKILGQATGATSHGNRHSIVSNFPDVRFLIGLLVESAVFEIKPGRDSDRKEFRDLYATESILLAGGTPIDRLKRGHAAIGILLMPWTLETTYMILMRKR